MTDTLAKVLATTATISDCGVYRYDLTRDLSCLPMITASNVAPAIHHVRRTLVVCGLNPSTADAVLDDPTIRREKDFAIRWGCLRLHKVNAYAFRSTDPKLMFAAQKNGTNIVGRVNDAYIEIAARLALETNGIFLVAWGSNIEAARELEIEAIVRKFVTPMCIKTNQDGSPVHPLYQKKESVPIAWSSKRRKP